MGKNLLTVKDLTVNVEEKEILHGVNLTDWKRGDACAAWTEWYRKVDAWQYAARQSEI